MAGTRKKIAATGASSAVDSDKTDINGRRLERKRVNSTSDISSVAEKEHGPTITEDSIFQLRFSFLFFRLDDGVNSFAGHLCSRSTRISNYVSLRSASGAWTMRKRHEDGSLIMWLIRRAGVARSELKLAVITRIRGVERCRDV